MANEQISRHVRNMRKGKDFATVANFGAGIDLPRVNLTLSPHKTRNHQHVNRHGRTDTVMESTNVSNRDDWLLSAVTNSSWVTNPSPSMSQVLRICEMRSEVSPHGTHHIHMRCPAFPTLSSRWWWWCIAHLFHVPHQVVKLRIAVLDERYQLGHGNHTFACSQQPTPSTNAHANTHTYQTRMQHGRSCVLMVKWWANRRLEART